MRVLLSTYGSRGDVQPLVGLAVRLRALGAQVRVCAPPDFAERLAEVGVPLVPVGRPVRPLVTGATPPSAADLPRRAAELVAAQFDTVAEAAEGCDLDAQNINELFGAALNTHRAAIGLPPLDNVRDYVITDQPWLATDPTLDPWQEPADSTSCRPARGSCPTFAHSRPSWWRSWTSAHHRCMWASAAWQCRPLHCAPRRTSPGWPSRRSARRAAAHSSPTAGPTSP